MTVLQFPAASNRPALARLLAITAWAWRLSAPASVRHLPLPQGTPQRRHELPTRQAIRR